MSLLLVELVGPSGSGKSTISACIAEEFDYVGPLTSKYFPINRLSVLMQISVIVAQHGWLWLRFGKRFNRNLRHLYAVQKSLIVLSRLEHESTAVDEGPLHGLMSFRIGSKEEARFWKSYARDVVAQIANQDVRVIVAYIKVDEDVRFERRKVRAGVHDHRRHVFKAATASEFEARMAAKFPLGRITAFVEKMLRRKMAGQVAFVEIANNSDAPNVDELLAMVRGAKHLGSVFSTAAA